MDISFTVSVPQKGVLQIVQKKSLMTLKNYLALPYFLFNLQAVVIPLLLEYVFLFASSSTSDAH